VAAPQITSAAEDNSGAGWNASSCKWRKAGVRGQGALVLPGTFYPLIILPR
jgi:hypothetical protein